MDLKSVKEAAGRAAMARAGVGVWASVVCMHQGSGIRATEPLTLNVSLPLAQVLLHLPQVRCEGGGLLEHRLVAGVGAGPEVLFHGHAPFLLGLWARMGRSVSEGGGQEACQRTAPASQCQRTAHRL